MQIIRYTRNDLRAFCPVTGQPLLNELSPAAPTVRGSWVDEMMDEPEIVDPELQEAWTAFVAACEAAEEAGEAIELETFFEQYEHPGWVVFELTNTESDVPSRGWVVVDMEMEMEESDAD